VQRQTSVDDIQTACRRRGVRR